MAVVILGMPAYGQIHAGAARAFWGCPSDGRNRVLPGAKGSSLLAAGFNDIWHSAVQIRKNDRPDITHFAMLHADIVPEPGWVDILVEEIERTGADVVSAVVPIKNTHGLTSTAIEDPDDEWSCHRRLTMREVMRLPETFSAKDLNYPDNRALLINTGCWIADLSKPWCADVCFTIRDHVRYPTGPDGPPEICVVPEDWGFSKFLHDRGALVCATRRVSLNHMGGADGYPNTEAWGDWHTDEHYRSKHDGVSLPLRRTGLADGIGRTTVSGTRHWPNSVGNRLVEGEVNDLSCTNGKAGSVS